MYLLSARITNLVWFGRVIPGTYRTGMALRARLRKAQAVSPQPIAIGLLDLRLLGSRLRELLPVEDSSEFNDLIRAIDRADLRTLTR